MKKILKAFTLIELMVGLSLSILAIGTFFKLYKHSVVIENVNALKGSSSVVGQDVINKLSSAIRLTAFSSDYSDFASNNIITKTVGGNGTQSVDFEFMSNFGGPVTVIKSVSGNAPSCHIVVHASANLFSNITQLKILGSNGVYTAGISSVTDNTIVFSSLLNASGTAVSGPSCISLFPQGAVVTSKGYKYDLKYNYSGTNSALLFTNETTGETLIDISPATSNYYIPFMVVQFMREYTDGTGAVVHKWFTGNSPNFIPAEVNQIKAVRIGFVIVSKTQKIKGAKGVVSKSMTYCPFENFCYSLPDLNKVAYVFRTTVHLRNFDYLKRIDDKVL